MILLINMLGLNWSGIILASLLSFDSHSLIWTRWFNQGSTSNLFWTTFVVQQQNSLL